MTRWRVNWTELGEFVAFMAKICVPAFFIAGVIIGAVLLNPVFGLGVSLVVLVSAVVLAHTERR